MKQSKFSFFIFTLTLLAACSGASHYSRQNLSYLYKPEKETIHPQYFFYHLSDSISEFWFKIPAEDLLYEKVVESMPPRTNARLSVRIHLKGYPAIIRDTATITINTTETGYKGNITGAFNVNTYPGDLSSEVNLWDLNQGTGRRSFLELTRINRNQRENYLITDSTTGDIQFKPFLNKQIQKVNIQYGRGKLNTVTVGYYKADFPLPPPPFAVQSFISIPYRPDSTFVVSVKDSIFTLDVSKKGYYHIRQDTNQKEGLTLYQMSESFPAVTTSEELLLPLRYITSKEEYSALESSENIKEAIDRFWLKTGGSPERARELIKTFYTRIEDSNKMFTSYTEGWKTDRGMAYLIFGPPDIVYRPDNEEIWIYGKDNDVVSIRLTFSRLNNPFSDNDYHLERSELLKNFWYRSVEGWRQGRIF